MIQEIAPYKFFNEYRPAAPRPWDSVFSYGPGSVFLKEGREIIPLTWEEVRRKEPEIGDTLIYLFAIDDQRFYLAPDLKQELYEDCSLVPLRSLRTLEPGHLAFAGVTGHQLAAWYESRRYCGRCGHPMKKDAKERMVFCESCGCREYPKICPAVIVGIRSGDRLLLSKYEGRDYKRYALIAGFAEIGESIEDTVRREVMEEVGLKVKNITFYRSQPWSFTDTLLLGFYCDLDGSDQITLDTEELALAQWCRREEIPEEGENISLTKEMMMRFKQGQDKVPYNG